MSSQLFVTWFDVAGHQHLKFFTEIVVKLIIFYNQKLSQRSEYKSLEFKYSMAQKDIDRLEKELEVMKATQAGLE